MSTKSLGIWDKRVCVYGWFLVVKWWYFRTCEGEVTNVERFQRFSNSDGLVLLAYLCVCVCVCVYVYVTVYVHVCIGVIYRKHQWLSGFVQRKIPKGLVQSRLIQSYNDNSSVQLQPRAQAITCSIGYSRNMGSQRSSQQQLTWVHSDPASNSNHGFTAIQLATVTMGSQRSSQQQ